MTPTETRAAIQRLAEHHCRDSGAFFRELEDLRLMAERQDSPPQSYVAIRYAEKRAHKHFEQLNPVKLSNLHDQIDSYRNKANMIRNLATTEVKKKSAETVAARLTQLVRDIEGRINQHPALLAHVVVNHQLQRAVLVSAPPPAPPLPAPMSKGDAAFDSYLTKLSAPTTRFTVDLGELEFYES